MANEFNGVPISVYGPAYGQVAITPNDTTDLTDQKIRALRVGTAGSVAVQALGDAGPVTHVNCANGEILTILVKRVYLTGTTASDIVGFK